MTVALISRFFCHVNCYKRGWVYSELISCDVLVCCNILALGHSMLIRSKLIIKFFSFILILLFDSLLPRCWWIKTIITTAEFAFVPLSVNSTTRKIVDNFLMKFLEEWEEQQRLDFGVDPDHYAAPGIFFREFSPLRDRSSSKNVNKTKFLRPTSRRSEVNKGTWRI